MTHPTLQPCPRRSSLRAGGPASAGRPGACDSAGTGLAAFRRSAARLVLAAALALAAVSCGQEAEKADLALVNGRVWTANPAQPWAEAVAVRGNTIAAVGTTADIERLAGIHTRTVDLGGRLLIPGLNDAHLHFLSGSVSMEQVTLDGAADLTEMQKRVRAWAAAHPQAPWIVGRGWNYTAFPGGRFPARQDLDAAVSDRPVLMEAYDGHTTWVNSRALEVAGVTRATTFDGFGEVVKDPRTGEPTGILKEAADSLVRKAIPQSSEEERMAALRKGLAEARRLGITSALNATGDPDEFARYDRLLKAGNLTLRTALALTLDRGAADGLIAEYKALAEKHRDPMLRGGFVKLFADGVVESHTAAMLEPYADEPRQAGEPNFPPEELTGWVRRLDAEGFDVLVHAIGDRAVRMTLDAYERARAENPPRPRRHRIEHVETIAAADIARFRDLEVIASMQPLHGAPDPDGVWARNVGPERLHRAFAWRALRDAGAHLAHGSDWPVVTLNPYAGLYTAVTRGYTDGRDEPRWAPEQRLTLEQALVGYTLDAAYATSEEKHKGSIEPGKWADLAVLSQDLFNVPAEKILQTESLLTVVDGRVVHEAGPFKSER
jgi:hypothetical protein